MSEPPTALQALALSALIAPAQPLQPQAEGDVDCHDMEGFGRAEPVVRPAAALPADARYVAPGDVLVSMQAHAPRRAWVVGESRGRPQVTSAQWLVLRSVAFDAAYARHVLVSNEFELACKTLAPRRTRRRPAAVVDLSGVTISLPTMDLQARAARVMDRADALRAQRALVVERARMLADALYFEAFGAAPEMAHASVPLSTLLTQAPCRGIDVGLDAQGRFPVIRSVDMHEGEVSLNDARYVSRSDATLARTALADGDVLLARESGRAQIRVAIARPGEAVWFVHQKVWRLRADPARALPEYLRAWFVSQAGQRSLVQAWLSARPRVPVEHRLARVTVPLPPIQDQQRFAERLNAAQRLAGRLHASSERLDALLGTLRDLAFRGELKLA